MNSPGIIYLVRHCSTANDESKHPVVLGQKHLLGLSAEGRRQAEMLGEHFAGRSIDAVYSSSLARAVQTARIINLQLSVPTTFCTSLVEVNSGEWEGKTSDEILRADPQRFESLRANPGNFGYPGGENLKQVANRAVKLIQALAERHASGRALVIAHKHVNRAIIAKLFNVPWERAGDIDQDPGCVNVIRVANGELKLVATNWTNNLIAIEEEVETV